jgi:regulator of protease activity HflC (stomatin/prohibitin superfamily)
MLALRNLLMYGGFGMILVALGILGYDLYREFVYRTALATTDMAANTDDAPVWRWRTSIALLLLAWGPILLAFSIVVIPSGMAGVRVSQSSGTEPGTLYPGVHLVKPLIEDVALFDIRDQVFTTGSLEDGKPTVAKAPSKPELLEVQAKEGLILGLAITVRYRLDPRHLDYIQSNLPHPVEKEIVPPVVASVWRDLVPHYTVRDVFSAKREEVRQRAAALIAQKLSADGIVVKEVMLRDIQLPEEYAKGLETLLLKEQENDQMGVETELKQKHVRIAELEAEANKV